MHDHRPLAEDLAKLWAGGVTAKVFNFALDVLPAGDFAATASTIQDWPLRALGSLEATLEEIEQLADRVCLARCAGDVVRAKREGKVAVFLGSEGGKLLGGRLEFLRVLHRLGMRELQLAWASENELLRGGSLTDFGKRVVAEANRLGVALDLSHLPEPAFFQALRLSRRPVIVSHCAARAVSTDLSDQQIEAVANHGGVLGIHFYQSYHPRRAQPEGGFAPPTPDDVVDQIEYVGRLVGFDYVGLGVDFFPTTAAWREFQRAQGIARPVWAINDASEMPRITQALLARGISEPDVRKVLGLNFLRVCRAVFGA